MSRAERSRLEVFARVRDGQISVNKAAGLVGLSQRQARRLWLRYREKGDVGLVHGLRGKPGNRRMKESVRTAVVGLYREKYPDFGPTLAAEHLERKGYEVDHETLRRLLLVEGLWSKSRRRKKHRSRRERRECLGEMVQMDGSPHDWFEGRGKRCVLMVMIDDATGRTYARFFEEETTAGCFEIFGKYVRKYGLPRSLYVDRDSIYRCDRQSTVQEELRGEGPPTQFGRAMKELDVELILANSPQAKGRVERMNGTMQDRLVKEMRLMEISDMASGNKFLEKTFLAALNRKFTVKARGQADLHRRLEAGQKLDEILSFQEQRTVSADWCVRWRNRIFQLNRRHEAMGLAGREVTVREKLGGRIELLSQGHKLHWKELKEAPARAEPRRVIRNNERWVPPAGHPWRGVPAARASSAAPPQPAQRVQGVTLLLS